jgi:predicted transcriptional regulator
MNTLSAIPIRSPFIEQILAGAKTWEIRSKKTKKIGPVALIQSGSGTVVGTATLSRVVELTPGVARAHAEQMGLSADDAADCAGLYAWVLEDVVKLKAPVRYVHPSGAVVWVTLDEETARKVNAKAARSRA